MNTLVDKNDHFERPTVLKTFVKPDSNGSYFLVFFEDGEKKNCTNRLKDERRRENRRTLSYSVSLKDTLRMKKTSKNEKKM